MHLLKQGLESPESQQSSEIPPRESQEATCSSKPSREERLQSVRRYLHTAVSSPSQKRTQALA